MNLSTNAANEILRQYDLTCKESPTLLSTNEKTTVYRCGQYVIKQSDDVWLLKTEALMLRTLAKADLPVPTLYGVGERGLVSGYIDHEKSTDADEKEIARLLAMLHAHHAKAYGFEQDTTIGPFCQSNPWTSSWCKFFCEQRILPFAASCEKEGHLHARYMVRIEKLMYKLPDLIIEPEAPSLLHGDVWQGNVLTCKEGIVFIDPACYYGHPEIELAFIAMFDTFKKRFFECYNDYRRIELGFFEERIYLYQLFPYLVHVRAFGDSYMSGVERILKRFGC